MSNADIKPDVDDLLRLAIGREACLPAFRSAAVVVGIPDSAIVELYREIRVRDSQNENPVVFVDGNRLIVVSALGTRDNWSTRLD